MLFRVAALRLVIAAVGPVAAFAAVVEPEHLRVVLSIGPSDAGKWSLVYPSPRRAQSPSGIGALSVLGKARD